VSFGPLLEIPPLGQKEPTDGPHFARAISSFLNRLMMFWCFKAGGLILMYSQHGVSKLPFRTQSVFSVRFLLKTNFPLAKSQNLHRQLRHKQHTNI
jgi:hypothetical protein